MSDDLAAILAGDSDASVDALAAMLAAPSSSAAPARAAGAGPKPDGSLDLQVSAPWRGGDGSWNDSMRTDVQIESGGGSAAVQLHQQSNGYTPGAGLSRLSQLLKTEVCGDCGALLVVLVLLLVLLVVAL